MKRSRWRNEARPRAQRLHPRAARAIVFSLALVIGIGAGALSGEALVARAFPERAARLRLALVGNREAPALELAAAAGIGPGARLAGLDLAAVRSGVAAHPWVASVRVTTLPPDLLLVSVREREPIAQARIGAEVWLVDRSAHAFLPAAPGSNLPALTGIAAKGDPKLAEGVAWLDALAAHGIAAPRTLRLADRDAARAPALELSAAAPAPGAVVLLGAAEERDAKLARLAALLAFRLPELFAAGEIDLRFGGEVILRPRPEAEVANSSGISNGG